MSLLRKYGYAGFLIHLVVTALVAFLGSRLITTAAQEFYALPLTVPVEVQKEARLVISPPYTSVLKGGYLNVQIVVYPGTVNINAVGATIKYSPKLEVVKLSREASFCTLYPEEYIEEEKQLVRIGCGTPSPGLNKSSGIVGTITFRAKESGFAEVELDPDTSSVHADDGKGTDVLASVEGALLNIVARPEGATIIEPPALEEVTISSPTHPDPNQWYPENDVIVRWLGTDDSCNYTTLMDNNPESVPDPTITVKINRQEFTGLSDGIWYFHLRAKSGSRLGPVSHFRIKIDTTPPELYISTSSPVIKEGGVLTVAFFSTDAEELLARVDNETFVATTPPFLISNLAKGGHQITVRAKDRAGNTTDKSVIVYVESESFLAQLVDRLIYWLFWR